MYYLQRNKYSSEIKLFNGKIKWLKNERKQFIDRHRKDKFNVCKTIHILDVSTTKDELYLITSLDASTLDDSKIVHSRETNCYSIVESCIGIILNDNKYVRNDKIKQDTYCCRFNKIKTTLDKLIDDIHKIKKVDKSTYVDYYTDFIDERIRSNRAEVAVLNTKIENLDTFLNSGKTVFVV